MAEKNSFILYYDQQDIFESLSDELAGKLVKHIFNYVNGNDSPSDEAIVNVAFVSIRQQFKRDSVRYENVCERNRINGSKGGRPTKPTETQKTQSVITQPKQPDNDNDNDNETNTTKVSTPPPFLTWFNKQKEIHTNKSGGFKALSKTDLSNLKQLKASYNNEDFERAFKGMANNPWVKENNAMNPTHFLRVDNFNRYLDQDSTPQNRAPLNPLAVNMALKGSQDTLNALLAKGWTLEELKAFVK